MRQIRDDKLLKMIALGIKSLRQENNITQELFYNDTGIHLARIETGKNNLSVSTLKIICKYFDISLTEFFSRIKE